eukprot:5580777-Prymnesium_polylepis.1
MGGILAKYWQEMGRLASVPLSVRMANMGKYDHVSCFGAHPVCMMCMTDAAHYQYHPNASTYVTTCPRVINTDCGRVGARPFHREDRRSRMHDMRAREGMSGVGPGPLTDSRRERSCDSARDSRLVRQQCTMTERTATWRQSVHSTLVCSPVNDQDSEREFTTRRVA